MMRHLVFLLVVLVSLAQCTPGRSSSKEQKSKSGLQIDNSPTRGLGFTDTLGMEYGLVYITSTLTNSSAIPIEIHLAIPKAYKYPIAYGDETFTIISLPKEWGRNGFDITDEMISEVPTYKAKPFLTMTLKPREEYVVTIGISRPRRQGLCSATPYALVEFSDRENFPSCEWASDEDKSAASHLELGLKVGFCTRGEEFRSCMIIPCGQLVPLEQ